MRVRERGPDDESEHCAQGPTRAAPAPNLQHARARRQDRVEKTEVPFPADGDCEVRGIDRTFDVDQPGVTFGGHVLAYESHMIARRIMLGGNKERFARGSRCPGR